MAFGTGSAVAHRAVDSVMGPRTIQHEQVVSEAAAAAPSPATNMDACSIHSKAFQDVCEILYIENSCHSYLFLINFCILLYLSLRYEWRRIASGSYGMIHSFFWGA